MKRTLTILLAGGLWLPCSLDAKTLYVDWQNGNDATSWAQNDATHPWRTIGRASWGSANRNTPDTDEAAQAGDTVQVAAGTYATGGNSGTWDVAYYTRNSGEPGNPIIFNANGIVTLTSTGSGPTIGASSWGTMAHFPAHYITWRGFTIDESNAPSNSDSGVVAVAASSGTIIENCDIIGIPNNPRQDNYNGIRIQASYDIVIRSNRIRNIYGAFGRNHAAIMTYYSGNVLIENNEIIGARNLPGINSGSGIYLKADFPHKGYITVRNNIFADHEFGAIDVHREPGTSLEPIRIYNNIFRNCRTGVLVNAFDMFHPLYGNTTEPRHVKVVNNTFVNTSDAVLSLVSEMVPVSSHVFWNNIVSGVAVGIRHTTGASPLLDKQRLDSEHNLIFGAANFAEIGGINRTLAVWRSTYGQDIANPLTITSDPQFVNAALNDFHLQAGSPARTLGVDILDLNQNGSTTDIIPAGAYVNGDEIIGLLGGAPPLPPPAGILYVSPTGNDNVSRANNSAATPWRTIGRAAWGSTNRDVPDPNEAVRAGETVRIAAGTYAYAGIVNDRWGILYNPVRSGTEGQYITFSCSGVCTLEAPNADSPVIGSDNKNYIKWFADVTQGHYWNIRACGMSSGCAANTVNTEPDTGPVVCHGGRGCWIEGAVIDGGAQTDFTDNWDGIRVENSSGAVIRNNLIRNFRNQDNTANGTAIKFYGSADGTVEHNEATNAGTGMSFKDTGDTLPQNNVHVRFNKFVTDRCFGWSTTAEDRNYVYQNICLNNQIGLGTTGGGLSNDWIFNNTIVNPQAGVFPTSAGYGGRFWNNIVVDADVVLLHDGGGTVPAENVLDFEHNLYHAYTEFYNVFQARGTFADFLNAHPEHDHAVPASLSTNPLFVNAAANDFRLQAGSPARTLAVDIMDLDRDGSYVDIIPAGAYVSGNEVIGIDYNGAAPPPPPPPPADTTPPTVPTGLAAAAVSSSQIQLSWNASSDAAGVTGYRIFRGGAQIATVSVTAFTDSGLTASTAYSYTVAAYDAAGNVSAQSTASSATTLLPPIPANYPLELINIKPVGTVPTGLSANNRIYRAYPGIEYNIRAGVMGGVYPYFYALSGAPSGMTINSFTGEISWPNPPNNTTVSPTITVTDTVGTQVSATWPITVTTNGFRFLDAVNGRTIANGGTGTFANPWRTLADMYNGSTAGMVTYLRAGTYTPAGMPTEGTPGPIQPETGVYFAEHSHSVIWIGYPGDARPLIDFGHVPTSNTTPRFRIEGINAYIDRLETTRSHIMAFQLIQTPSGQGATVRRCVMHDGGHGIDGSNAAFIMTTRAGNLFTVGSVIQDNEMYRSDYITPIKTYEMDRLLIENNTIRTNLNDFGGIPSGDGAIAIKGAHGRWEIRGNQTYDADFGGAGGNMDGAQNGEIRFNNFFANGNYVALAINQQSTAGPIAIYRNTLRGRVWVRNVNTSDGSVDGPFTFRQNIIINNDNNATPPYFFYYQVVNPERVVLTNNLFGVPSSNVVDANGLLPVGSPHLGIYGHQLVGAPGAPPPPPPPPSNELRDPVLRLPSAIPINAAITLENAGSYAGATFTWNVTPVVGASGSGAAGVMGAPRPVLATSSVPRLSLASMNLSLGPHLITVQASIGAQTSALASANVTLVQANLDAVRVYPNPWRSDRHTARTVTFDNLTVNTNIKIFSTSGHHVKTLPASSSSVVWDLTNESGDRVASGMYLYVMKADDGSKKTGKLVLIK